MLAFLLMSLSLEYIANVHGSVIVFTSDPSNVIEGLTPQARVRCALNDTAASSASVIGRRDVTTSQDNVEQVSSIIIMQGGVDVASVSQSHSAVCLLNASNLHVTGGLQGARGERGYLELSLHYPTLDQLGEYSCEISAVSSTGHGVIYTTNVEVTSSPPTMADLVSAINQGKAQEQLQQDLITAQQQLISAQQSNISVLQQHVTALQNYIDFETKPGLQVRLLGGDGRSYGAVQLRYNQRTGLLCDDYFDHNNHGAQVVCRMLGFSHGTYEDGNHFYHMSNTDIPVEFFKQSFLLDNVVCTGTESDLTQCSHLPWGEADPNGVDKFNELAGVRCS